MCSRLTGGSYRCYLLRVTSNGHVEHAMIVICEPQSRGFEHAMEKAALIGTVTDAFQEEGLLFLAKAQHIRSLKNILDALGPSQIL